MKKIKLIAAPFAGGNKDAFENFANALPENIELSVAEYSGHGRRIKEPFYENFPEMVADTVKQINEMIEDTEAYALLGYSMGSAVVYEAMASGKLSKRPEFLILASHEAPDVAWRAKDYKTYDDVDFLKAVQALGGFENCTEENLKNKFFRMLHFNPLRADYKLIGMYEMSKFVPIEVPVLFFYSLKDMTEEEALNWERFFEGKHKFVEMGDNHFFIKSHADEMVKNIVEWIEDI